MTCCYFNSCLFLEISTGDRKKEGSPRNMQNMLSFDEDAYNASLLFGIVQPDIGESVPIKLRQKQDHYQMNRICRIICIQM